MKTAKAVAKACDGLSYLVGMPMLRAGLEAVRKSGEIYSAKVASSSDGAVMVEVTEAPGDDWAELTCKFADVPEPPPSKYPAKEAKPPKAEKSKGKSKSKSKRRGSSTAPPGFE